MRRMNILSPGEVAEELQATAEQVIEELEAGRLLGFKFAGEWRTTEEAVRSMIEDLSHSTTEKEGMKHISILADAKRAAQKGIPTVKQLASLRWEQISFQHFWPKAKTPEVYAEAFQSKVLVAGKEVPLIIGRCLRGGAGVANRPRAVVFLGEQGHTVYPLVQFTGANDFNETGMMASIILSSGRKQCRADQPLPSGYDDLPTGIYSNLVNGPYATGSRCVIASNTDFAVMARHALLRGHKKTNLGAQNTAGGQWPPAVFCVVSGRAGRD